jgi:hypothetical protein
MDPAVLAHLVGRIHIDSLAGSQSLHQLAAKLGLAGLLVAFGFQLAQPLARAADHQIAHPHPLAAQAQGVERLAHGRGLGDGMAISTIAISTTNTATTYSRARNASSSLRSGLSTI